MVMRITLRVNPPRDILDRNESRDTWVCSEAWHLSDWNEASDTPGCSEMSDKPDCDETWTYKDDAINQLERMFNSVFRTSRFGFGFSALPFMGIRVEHLSLIPEDDGALPTQRDCYFRPLRIPDGRSCSQIECGINDQEYSEWGYPSDELDSEPCQGYDMTYKSFVNRSKWLHRVREDCDIFSPSRTHAVSNQDDGSWYMDNGWVAKDLPHVMLVLAHRKGSKNELLIGELITILLAMITRYSLPSLQEHTVIPVMALSIMDRKFRIIQAHWDGTDVVARLSPLYKQKNGAALRRWFIGYLACEPVGDTTSLPR